MNSPPSMNHRVGLDHESISRLVHGFYDDVRADEVLAPTFDTVLGDRWAAHLPRMAEFWSTVMLGTRSFAGNVFGKHMAVEGVTPLHFKRWLALWIAHTDGLFEPATARDLQQVASGIARNLYRGHFGHAAAFDGIDSEVSHATR